MPERVDYLAVFALGGEFTESVRRRSHRTFALIASRPAQAPRPAPSPAMAFSLFRIGRFLRSVFSPLAAFVVFSCLLTFLFVLYQPNAGPGAKQRVGWQSWEIINEVPVSGSSVNDNTGSTAIGTPSQADGVDWWNVTTPERPTLDSASLPLDVWDPMLPHDTGCMCSPELP